MNWWETVSFYWREITAWVAIAAVPTEDGDVWRWELPTVHDASRVRMDLRARLAE